jgi:hypothetical protein
MDFLGYVAGEMFLNLFGLRNPNAVLPDFWIYFGSLLCPLFNEHGFVRVLTDRRRAAVYAKDSQGKMAAASARAQMDAIVDSQPTSSGQQHQVQSHAAPAGGRSSPVAG